MVQRFENEVFDHLLDRDSGQILQDMEFRGCQFVGSSFSITRDPRRRSTARKMSFGNCRVTGCSLRAAVVEDVEIDGLRTSDLFQTWAAVFRRVTLKGRIDRIMISPYVAPGSATPEQQRAFDEANRIFYSETDWALDIREGEFKELEIQSVPSHLIRRDPETQVIVRREAILDGNWRQVDLSGTHWATSISFMLKRGDRDVLLVAGKRDRQFKRMLEGLNRLRDAGFAE